MARRKRRGTSVRQYFREVFEANPELLALSDNSQVLKKWSDDHGGKEPDRKIKQNMAACKSDMRVERGMATKGPHKRGRKKAGAAVAVVTAVAPQSVVPDVEKLETMIYDCVSLARALDVAELEPVVKH